ncbi:MAG: DUF2254 domain-containing protein [Ornithinimicrobium sp.]
MTTDEHYPRVSPAPAPQPRRRTDDARRRLRRAFAPFWVVPTLSCVLALGLGIVAPEVDQRVAEFVPFLFPAGTDGARTMLSTIAGAMISLTGLVFSITIVVLQLASSQFSPRVLRTFLDERIPQFTLGVFAASFIYALTVLRSVSGTVEGESTDVPQIAVTLAFLLVLASVAMFLAFIHHITQSISVEVIIQSVGQETRDLLQASRAEAGRARGGSRGEDRLSGSERAPRSAGGLTGETDVDTTRTVVVCAKDNGYLNYVDAPSLVEAGARHQTRIEMVHTIGTFVVIDQPLAMLRPVGQPEQPSLEECQDDVRSALSLTSRRSMEQDVTFGLRQLVDIAERALSPGVNDPTTAVQVLNELHTILRLIATAPSVPTTHDDKEGVLRLITSEWTFDRYLDMCVDEIAHWGASSIQVPHHIEAMLTQLAVIAHPDHTESIVAKAAQVRARMQEQR